MSHQSEITANIRLQKSYSWLMDPARIKVCYGGRGAGRTWDFVRYLLLRAIEKKRRILCTREIQNSILESTHAAIKSQIELLGLEEIFDIRDNGITCTSSGTEFIFMGLYRNVNKIKSLEGINICDVEEAENVSNASWSVLLPTIFRQEDSECLVRFNTGYEDDDTYDRFVVHNQPNSIVKITSYLDNKYFPAALDEQRKADLAYKPLEYPNIWEGKLKGYGRKVWQDFEENVHVKEFDWKDIQYTANCYMATDPAMHYWPFMLWAAKFPMPGNEREFITWIYDEYPGREVVHDDFHEIRKKLLFSGTLSDLSRDILVKDGTLIYGNRVLKRGIDTRFTRGTGSGSFFSGDTLGLVSEWARKDNGGLVFTQPNVKIIDAQKDRIHTALAYNHLAQLTPYNQPHLYVSNKCKNLLISLRNHRLEEDCEKEAEKYKDASDTLRILFATMDGEQYQAPQQPNSFEAFSTTGMNFVGQTQSQNWMGV